MPCLPGADGQGVQKWVRNVSYFREFTAALFLEPWQGLLKAFLSFSAFLSSTPFSTKCLGVFGVAKKQGGIESKPLCVRHCSRGWGTWGRYGESRQVEDIK